MKETTYKLTVTFLEPVLGSQSTKHVASEFIAKRAGLEDGLPEDEFYSLPEALERGTTVFHRDAVGRPVLFDYQLKGFMKNSAKVQNGKVDGETKNLRSKVNDLVFISPRAVALNLPENGEMKYLERPLRAETAMGPRVALARSEMLPEGTWFSCGMTVLGDTISEAAIRDLLDYGFWQGIGQWRNGGWGKFRYELVREQ